MTGHLKRRELAPFAAAIGMAALVATAHADATGPTVGYGPNPELPEPDPSLIPTVEIVPAAGWPEGAAPASAPGTTVTAFADRLDHPRWLHVLPNGDVLVAETNAPDRPEATPGIKGFFMRWALKRTGAVGESADRITLLRDGDGDGVAETRSTFLTDLHSPFGMALVGDDLYVANTDAILRFAYVPDARSIDSPSTLVVELPSGPVNRHWTRNVVASPDGLHLYASVGSNSNVAERGLEEEVGRAAIWEIDLADGAHRIQASGLRNPVGMTWEPTRSALWVVVNERDELGNDLVPDYMTAVRRGGFYGWPYSYFGSHVDERVTPRRPELVERAIVPDYALGAHTASLGLVYSAANALPERFHGGVFVGQHGSWNRDPISGYKVVFVAFEQGEPFGMPIDVLTGFVNGDGEAQGRPVGVAIDANGGLLVADDVGNVVWRVAAASGRSARR